MIRRILAALAVAVLAFTGLGVAPANAANAMPGVVWAEKLPSGELVEFTRTADGWDISTHPLRTSDLFSCTNGYACVWTGLAYTGTFGRYWANNIYANTANGVAHCWNMTAPLANNSRSWANFSQDRDINWYNWQNCNAGGTTLGWWPRNTHRDCQIPGYSLWCGNDNGHGISSIRASA
jgi:hypothetical protein